MLVKARCSPLPIRNCFGYLISTVDYDAGCHRDIFRPRSSPSGYFTCHVRNSADVNSSAQSELPEIVLQCFQISEPAEILLLDDKFSAACSINDGNIVFLEPLYRVTKAEMIELSPDTFEDWNIFEQSAAHIEEIFLDQLRIVRPDMRFVLYLSTTVPCTFCIKTAVPDLNSAGSIQMALLIDTNTLVTVEPKHDMSSTILTNNYLGVASQTFLDHKTDNLAQNICRLLLPYDRLSAAKRTFRLMPQLAEGVTLPKIVDRNNNIIITANSESSYTNTYVVEVESVHPIDQNNESSRMCAIWLDISPACFRSDEVDGITLRTGFKAILQALQNFNEDGRHLVRQYCWISSALRRGGGSAFTDCTQIHILPLREAQTCLLRDVHVFVQPTAKEITIKDINASELSQQINRIILPLGNLPVLLQNNRSNNMLDSTNSCNYRLKLNEMPHDEPVADARKCSYFWPTTVRYHINIDHLGVNAKQSPRKVKKLLDNYAIESESKTQAFDFQTALLNQIETAILGKILGQIPSNLQTVHYRRHLLLSGSDFSGKTSILRFLACRLFHSPLTIFPCRVNCKEWIGLSPSAIAQSLQSTLLDLSARWPSVLFLDDFDFLEYSEDDDNEQSHFVISTYSKIFATIETNLQLTNEAVVILCTVQKETHLPSLIRFKEGGRLFSQKFDIPAISKMEQFGIVMRLINYKTLITKSHSVVNELSFTVGELCSLADRVRLQLNEAPDENTMIKALKYSLNNRPRVGKLAPQKHTKPVTVSFANVGGLDNVKRRLIEIFIWPIKYAKLYSQCGITLRSRAILHGPSGCGKTLLMHALATECGARFNVIHVRGPELLSKYIGDSEANVRGVFERARSTAPSLIVFDEFDALAPARGHDNTGVTDRVVNQLLTELDGVESDDAAGTVCVIAATNRLQAIDKALLRPGRFDHKIAVQHPATARERSAILRCHLADVRLAANVDVDRLSEQCDSEWSGAELRVWVLNAKLRSLSERNGEANSDTVTLTAEHFQQTFHESAPRTSFQYTAKDYARSSTMMFDLVDNAGQRITHA